jgi:prefoldin subunit 5
LQAQEQLLSRNEQLEDELDKLKAAYEQQQDALARVKALMEGKDLENLVQVGPGKQQQVAKVGC